MKKNLFFKFNQTQSKRVKKNFFALFSNFSTQILVQIIYPPLMLLFWGIENFGIWIFITAIPSTLSMLNLNFSLAVKIEMSINRKIIKFFLNPLYGEKINYNNVSKE